MKASEPRNDKWLKDSPPLLTMQYRGNPSQLSAAKVRLISGAQIIFTTRKLKTSLPSLKTSFARELRSKVVYKLTCKGCNSTYVGQTVRPLATRVDEHRKGDSPVGQHLLECNKEVGGTAELKSEIIDQRANTHKLLTLEAFDPSGLGALRFRKSSFSEISFFQPIPLRIRSLMQFCFFN